MIIAPSNALASIEAGRQADLDGPGRSHRSGRVELCGLHGGHLCRDGEPRDLSNRRGGESGLRDHESADATLQNVPAAVIASPTRAVVQNLAPVNPSIVGFYGPAALALVLQHMAVTLIALSIVRERSSGALDRFRASPMRATEVVLGKVLAFGLLGGAIAAISTWLMVSILGVPMLGSPGAIALVILLLLVASLGLGLLISVVSDSERQTVQLSLLTLLASVFFSGFVLRIEEFQPAVQVAAYALPVTHGIALLQGLMLSGSVAQFWQVAVLTGIAGVLLVSSWALLRRELRPG